LKRGYSQGRDSLLSGRISAGSTRGGGLALNSLGAADNSDRACLFAFPYRDHLYRIITRICYIVEGRRLTPNILDMSKQG
jgi:hypothetical protein